MIELGSKNLTGPDGKEGESGNDGSTWLYGTQEPGSGLGTDGDFFFDQSTGDVWTKKSGEWEFLLNLKGPKGNQGKKGDTGPAGKGGKHARRLTYAGDNSDRSVKVHQIMSQLSIEDDSVLNVEGDTLILIEACSDLTQGAEIIGELSVESDANVVVENGSTLKILGVA